MVPEQTRGKLAAHVVGVVRPRGHAQLARKPLRGRCRGQRHRAAEGSVAIRRGAHAALNLHRAEQRRIAVHVCPEHALVFGRVQRHAVERHVDARVAGSANAHIHGARAQPVLAPRQHARRLREEERQLASRFRECVQLLFPDVRHGERRVFLRPDALHHYLLQFFHRRGILLGNRFRRHCHGGNRGKGNRHQNISFHCFYSLLCFTINNKGARKSFPYAGITLIRSEGIISAAGQLSTVNCQRHPLIRSLRIGRKVTHK